MHLMKLSFHSPLLNKMKKKQIKKDKKFNKIKYDGDVFMWGQGVVVLCMGTGGREVGG